mmetsp:Transcript_15554/g.21488  ORF Transcript_15554/g.21488 Transcript_15554/m.21488 type:complete len:105 (-) Transcript_15554:532-846(-)
MIATFYPLLLLFSPSILIAISSISLFQFTQMFKGFVEVVKVTKGNAAWKFFQPHLKQIGFVLESGLGPASKFAPNTTHVVLVAVMLCMIICTERLRSAIVAKRP